MMSSVITIRVENENNTTIKVVGTDRNTIKMLSFLRSSFAIVKQKHKDDNNYYADYNLARPGVYILLSEDRKTIYIGQSDNVMERLNYHYGDQDNKEYWIDTMTFTRDGGNALNISQIKYIESKLISLAQQAASVALTDESGVAIIMNKQNTKLPNLSANDTIGAKNFLEDILILTTALGINFFEVKDIKEIVAKEKQQKEIYTYFSKDAVDAQMIISGDYYIVLKGSKGRIDPTESCPSSIKDKRQLLINSGQLKVEGKYLVAQEDINFDSASTPAAILVGGTANGRILWKNKEGKTLKDLET